MAQVISVPYVSLTTFTVIQRYYAFIWDLNNNTLALNVSVDGGATWTWPSLGTAPAGAQTPAAATAFFSGKVAADGSGINQFYAFVIGSDGNLWVCVSLDDGNTWNWQNQGVPPTGATISGPPAAISQQVQAVPFQQGVFCHVIGNDGNLYVNYSEDNGATWQWANLAAPPGTTLAPGAATSISFDGSAQQTIYAFAVGNDNNLYANYGDGTHGKWLSLEHPPTTQLAIVGNNALTSLTFITNVVKTPNAIIADGWMLVFAVGLDGKLYLCYSPGSGVGWQWQDLGLPQPGIQGFTGNALLVSNQIGTTITESVFASAIGALQLYMDFTADASQGSAAVWQWQPRGAPPNAQLLNVNGAVASSEVGSSLAERQIFVFVTDGFGDVHTCRWNGSQWTWYDQQGPP